jgi:RNA polymerase sigma factor (sigma-70 family)
VFIIWGNLLTSAQSKIFEEIKSAYKDRKRVRRWLVVADRYLKSYNNDKFERHWTAEDIVNEVITKTLENKRKWIPEKVPDLDKFIFTTIRSVVDDKVGDRNRVLPQKEKVQARRGDFENDLIEINNKTDKDYILHDIERIEIFEKCYNELLEDDDCAIVFLEWKEGKTSKDIAVSLGISVEEVERIKKRIRYNLNKNINHN